MQENHSSNFTTPILFLVFNRPDTTRQVFEIIKKIRPNKLYIASDGPRKEKINEENLVNEVRKIVLNIDWQCDVKILFRKNNLGCKIAVSNAISWFFNNEEMGIILEDDCLPDNSFFSFCQILLEKYKNHDEIMSICGSNINMDLTKGSSFFFSKYPLMWGWATWSRAWNRYDVNMKNYPKFYENNGLKNLKMGGLPFISLWKENFDKTYNGEIDTWDYQWIFCCWYHNGVTIAPNVNLVKNIGFSFEATHTKKKDSIRGDLQLCSMDTNLIYPNNIVIDYKTDVYISKYWFHISWINLFKSKLLKLSIISTLNNYKNKLLKKL